VNAKYTILIFTAIFSTLLENSSINVGASPSPGRWTGTWSLDGLEIDSDSGQFFSASNWRRSIEIKHTGGANYQIGTVGAAGTFSMAESGDDLVLMDDYLDPENAQVTINQGSRLHWITEDWAVFVQSSIGRDAQELSDTYWSSYNLGVLTRTAESAPLRPWEGTYLASEFNIESKDGEATINRYILNPTITLSKIDARHYRPTLILNDLNPAYDVLTVEGNYLESTVTKSTNGVTVKRFDRGYQLAGGRVCMFTVESFFNPQDKSLVYTGCYTSIGQVVPNSKLAVIPKTNNRDLLITQSVPGLSYALQSCSELRPGTAWSTLTNIVPTSSDFTLSLPASAKDDARFYRLAIEIPSTSPFQ
jgi:hypothetical protein